MPPGGSCIVYPKTATGSGFAHRGMPMQRMLVMVIKFAFAFAFVAAVSLRGCYGFSQPMASTSKTTRTTTSKTKTKTSRPSLSDDLQDYWLRKRSSPEASQQPQPDAGVDLTRSSGCNPLREKPPPHFEGRRWFVSSSLAWSAMGAGLWRTPMESALAAAEEEETTATAAATVLATTTTTTNADRPAAAPEQQRTRRIVRLSSGLQFSDARVGSGSPIVVAVRPVSSGNNNDNNNNDNVATKDANGQNAVAVGVQPPPPPPPLLMHLRALKRDGSVLLDTRDEGRPLLFVPGSIPAEELYYLGSNEGSALQKGRIPLGVQDAILAPGVASWEGGYGRADPMRAGGLRMVVVPPDLAYGSRGVSRYEAFRLGLRGPVARNEVLRYEIELFRCNDDDDKVVVGFARPRARAREGRDDVGSEEGESAGTTETPPPPSARVCCPDELYPCPTSTNANTNANANANIP